MKIGLIDVDGHNFPNIALMKLSAWQKEQKHHVEWCDGLSHYDVVFVSKVFDFSPDWTQCIDADIVIRGGTGYGIENDHPLPYHIEHSYPDYSLYNITDTAYGFLTRGCPRHCPFCIVGDKEGIKSVKVSDLSEFWSGQRNIVLCDPNILACKDREELLLQLVESRASVEFNQGLDARMLDTDTCKLLARIRTKDLHFAWDRYQDGDLILPKLEMYAKHGRKHHGQHAVVYTLVNFDTTLQQDLERIYTLRKLGYWAYVMVYDKTHAAPVYKRLQRWVNNRFVFAKCEKFDDYLDGGAK